MTRSIGARPLVILALGMLLSLAIAQEPLADRLIGEHIVAGDAKGSARSTAGASVSYPLRISANGRYIVDREHVPFLIVGDSPQSLIVNLSERQAAAYFANRKAAGFNAVWINLLCDDYTAGRPDGTTYDGIRPFTTPGDLSTPNEAYFSRADDMIRLAGKYGLTVFLAPIETGGWLDVLLRNGESKNHAYGEYVGNRYKHIPNIVWLNGNDFEDWEFPEVDGVVLAVAQGIKDADPTHLQTVEFGSPVSSSLDNKRWTSMIDLNATYSYLPTYAVVLDAYFQKDVMPTFMLEANYEFENSYAYPQTLRRQEYWSMLSGAAGQFYGNKYSWRFLPGWQRHLDTSGSIQMGYVTRLFSGRPWYKLVPDRAHTVVTAGYGRAMSSGSVNDSNYATAAHTTNGRLAIVYLPSRRTITVNMASFSNRVTARWYDPSSGRFHGRPLAGINNAGRRKFTPPGPNAEGFGDWLLLLTARPSP